MTSSILVVLLLALLSTHTATGFVTPAHHLRPPSNSNRVQLQAHKLVLVRHGESTWNDLNIFTGWADASLNEKGLLEASQGGTLLKEGGYTFDVAYTSVLKRAIKTLWIVLEELDLMYIPIVSSMLYEIMEMNIMDHAIHTYCLYLCEKLFIFLRLLTFLLSIIISFLSLTHTLYTPSTTTTTTKIVLLIRLTLGVSMSVITVVYRDLTNKRLWISMARIKYWYGVVRMIYHHQNVTPPVNGIPEMIHDIPMSILPICHVLKV